MDTEEDSVELGFDVANLRDLVRMLREEQVQSFQGGGVTVVFREETEDQQFQRVAPKAQVEDDGHSTSNKPVEGFRHPSLYPFQNGKVLRFDGSLE